MQTYCYLGTHSESVKPEENMQEPPEQKILTVAKSKVVLLTFLIFVGALSSRVTAAVLTPPLSSFGLTNTSADGSVDVGSDNLSFTLTGGNTGSGLPGSTDFFTVSQTSGLVEFQYSYSSFDLPGFDSAGYRVGNIRTQLSFTDGESGFASLTVSAGQIYGWWVDTADNTGEPGILSVSFSPAITPAPEPASFVLLFAGFAAVVAIAPKSAAPRTAGPKKEI
jgi:hypothetical protein